MQKISGTRTEKDLREAFAGESQANRRYLAYAIKAEREGHAGLARLFRAVAEAETIHAHAQLKILGGVGSSADNLRAAIGGETHESTVMYPAMIAHAMEERIEGAHRIFSYAHAVEQAHARLFQKALEQLEKGEEPGADFYVCKVCGHTVEGEPPGPCPVCNAPTTAYCKID